MDKLRALIREAFNTAHAIANLREGSAQWAAKLSPEQLATANTILADALRGAGRWREAHWHPGEAAFMYMDNYIFDKMMEGWLTTHDSKYKWAMYHFYSPSLNPKISSYWFYTRPTISGVISKNPDDFAQKILEPVLTRVFVGTETEPAIIDTESPAKDTGSYGGWFNKTIFRELFGKGGVATHMLRGATKSLDEPSKTTGKTNDVEDMDQPKYMGGEENPELTAAAEKAAAEDTYGTEEKPGIEPDEEELKAQAYSGYGYEEKPGGIDPSVSPETERRSYDAQKQLAKLYDTFEEISAELKIAGVRGPSIVAFMESLEGLFPEEIANKHPEFFSKSKDVSNSLNNLVKLNPKFRSIVPDILKKNGFPAGLFNDMEGKAWEKLRTAIRNYKEEALSSEKTSKKPYVWQQYVGEEKSLEEIINENFDTIMQRVQAKMIIREIKGSK